MKQSILVGTILLASHAASAGVPAWCGDTKGDANSEELRTLNTSKDLHDVIPALANALCTATPEMEAHRAELDAARAAWGKKLGMSDADWADVPVFTAARLGNFFKTDMSTKDITALTPIDQYETISHQGALYMTDALHGHLSETGRMAFIDYCLVDDNVARPDGTMAKWAMCWPDIEKFDAAKVYAEISADKAHEGAARMWLRFHAHDLPGEIKVVADRRDKFFKKDDVWTKVFDAAAKARGEWDKTVGGNTKLLELALTMDGAAIFHSRKLLDGCEPKTEEALAAAVATIPAKSFAGWHDDREMTKPGFAESAAPLLVNTPAVNIAAVAYTECHSKTATADYLNTYLQRVTGARGPRNYALGVLMGTPWVFDDTNEKGMQFPEFGSRPYSRSGGAIMSRGGVVKSVKKDKDTLDVTLEKTSLKQDDCVKEHPANRAARVRENGSIEYEMICDKWQTVTHDNTWPNFKVNLKYEKVLKPGVVFSAVNGPGKDGDDIVAIWPNKTAKMPSWVIGGPVK